MKNQVLETKIKEEIRNFIQSRKSLQLSSLTEEGKPYASYAPFAIGDDCLYVLLSEIAVHAVNLQKNSDASVLIIEDEDTAKELFACMRVSYSVSAEHVDINNKNWQLGIDILAERQGDRIKNLSELADFKLFKLVPNNGRYVKGFGRAYAFKGASLTGEMVDHMREGHKKREEVA